MEFDDDFFARAKPAGRVKQKGPTKTRTTIRFSDEVLTVYKHMGRGWQTQMDNDLKELIANKNGKPKIPTMRRSRKRAVRAASFKPKKTA